VLLGCKNAIVLPCAPFPRASRRSGERLGPAGAPTRRECPIRDRRCDGVWLGASPRKRAIGESDGERQELDNRVARRDADDLDALVGDGLAIDLAEAERLDESRMLSPRSATTIPM